MDGMDDNHWIGWIAFQWMGTIGESSIIIVANYIGELKMCVKETMNWRYCWRAGVMSRNEGKKKEELLV